LNSRLKKPLAEAMLDNAGLKDFLAKMYGSPPSAKREAVAHVHEQRGLEPADGVES